MALRFDCILSPVSRAGIGRLSPGFSHSATFRIAPIYNRFHFPVSPDWRVGAHHLSTSSPDSRRLWPLHSPSPRPVSNPPKPWLPDQFWVNIAHPLPGAGGGLPAFAVTDRRDGQAGLMAVQARRFLPARAQALQSLALAHVNGLLAPLAYGAAPAPGGEEAGLLLICQAPPGPTLSAALRPWPEPELLAFVLRPIARTLDRLAERGLTHRAIRVDNVFRVGPGHPVVLGCAWATPPAALQSAAVEPPYVSVCLPGRRGEAPLRTMSMPSGS